MLVNILLDMTIKETNIDLEIFINKVPELILVYADDIDTVGSRMIKIKYIFLHIENEINGELVETE